MSLMLGKLYAALRLANVPDDKAIEAAEEVAGFENRLAGLDSRLNLVQWMLAFDIALSVVILGRLFFRPDYAVASA